MEVLLTGGAGFIGRAVHDQLAAAGNTIHHRGRPLLPRSGSTTSTARGCRAIPRTPAWPRSLPTASARRSHVFEEGCQRRNFIHVSDVAAAVLAALHARLPAGLTPLNIGARRRTAYPGRLFGGRASSRLASPDRSGRRASPTCQHAARATTADKSLGGVKGRGQASLGHGRPG